MNKPTQKHIDRVRDELLKAGMTKYGLLKGESRHLPALIKQDEHIGGVVYGRTSDGSAMLIATDKRVLYLDHKLLSNKSDELTYDVVSGVSSNTQGSYAGVILHTRLGDYQIKYVNLTTARRFVRYIESKRIVPVQEPDVHMPSFAIEVSEKQAQLSQKARIFLISHEVAVLSVITPAGSPHGAVVYYAADKNNNIFIVTKNQTKKAQYINQNSRVALTIYDTASMSTLQAAAIAHVEQDPAICKKIYETILRPRFEGAHAEMPPIMYLPAGEYEVIACKITEYTFSDYKNQV